MAQDCNASAASEATYPLEFIASRNTNIPIGQRSSGVCITPGALTLPAPSQGGVLGAMGSIAKVPTIINNPSSINSAAHGWSLSGFNVEAKGNIKIWWRADGHLMVTVTDLVSTLTGESGDTLPPFQAPLYSGPVGWALCPMLTYVTPDGVPTDNDPNWRMCIGGWWSAYMLACGDQCPDAWGNPGGGTMYWWNKWNEFDEKFVQNGIRTARRDGPIEWDMGKVEASEGLQVVIYGRGVRGYCGSQYFDPNMGARQAVMFAIPLPSICPPEILDLGMQRDICEERVWADVRVQIPELGGNSTANLTLQYSTDDFATINSVTQSVNANSVATVRVDPMYPNTLYCFRAKLSTDSVESDWSETVCDMSLFMPRADWVIPQLTEEECEAMTQGDCIDEFTETTPGLEQCKGDS